MIETMLVVVFGLGIVGLVIWSKVLWGLIIGRGLELDSDKIKIDYWSRQFQIVEFMVKNPFEKDKKFSGLITQARIAFGAMVVLIIFFLILRNL